MPSLACPESTESAPLAETKPIRCGGSCALFPGAPEPPFATRPVSREVPSSGGILPPRASPAGVTVGDAGDPSVLHVVALAAHLQVRSVHVLDPAHAHRCP